MALVVKTDETLCGCRLQSIETVACGFDGLRGITKCLAAQDADLLCRGPRQAGSLCKDKGEITFGARVVHDAFDEPGWRLAQSRERRDRFLELSLGCVLAHDGIDRSPPNAGPCRIARLLHDSRAF